MFQDLHIFDVHAHFQVKGDLTSGGRNLRTRETGPIENERAEQRYKERESRLAEQRKQWRLAFE